MKWIAAFFIIFKGTIWIIQTFLYTICLEIIGLSVLTTEEFKQVFFNFFEPA